MEGRVQHLLLRLRTSDLLLDVLRLRTTRSWPWLLSSVPGGGHLPSSGALGRKNGQISRKQMPWRIETGRPLTVCSCSGDCWFDLFPRPAMDTQLHGVWMLGIHHFPLFVIICDHFNTNTFICDDIPWTNNVVLKLSCPLRSFMIVSSWIHWSILWGDLQLSTLRW